MKEPSAARERHRTRARVLKIQRRFGLDFSGTRIWRSTAPSRLGMWACAVGSDVIIAQDAPSTTTRDGTWLLAHELAHTLQHRILSPPDQGFLLLSEPALEAEADRFADAVVASLWDGMKPDVASVPSAPGPVPAARGVYLQPAFRHKFEFIPATNVLPVWQFLVAKISRIFDEYAQEKHDQADTDYKAMTVALQTPGGANAHPILHAYEKAHLQHGKDWHELVTTLLKKCSGQIEFSDDPSAVNLMRHDAISIFARHSKINGQPAPRMELGSVNFGRHRFQSIKSQPVGAQSVVLERIAEPRKHYIYAPKTDTYVRRFVLRGLNQADALNLDNGKGFEAPHAGAAQKREIQCPPKQASRHHVKEGVPLELSQELLSHTRGWQKRFISTGVSDRPALSTRGAPFASVFGAVTIDLAKVDPNTIFPLDSHLAAERLLGGTVRALEVVEASAAQPTRAPTTHDEEFLAMRDVLRTRELVIKGAVPRAAIECQKGTQDVLGIAGTSKDGRHPAMDIPQAKWPRNNERLGYPWQATGDSTIRWWWFAAYDDLRQAQVAAGHLCKPKPRILYLGTYKPVRPPGAD